MGMWDNIFGKQPQQGPQSRGDGAIVHNPSGRIVNLPSGNPQQNLNGNQSQQQQQQHEPTEPVDPINSQLEELSAFWQTPTTADGKPVQQAVDPLYQPIFDINNPDNKKALLDRVSQVDFTAKLSPELAAKALGGDPAALAEYVNGAVRGAFGAAMLDTRATMDQGFQRHSQSIDSALPTRIKRHQLNTMESENPILQHASMKPMLGSLRQLIANNRPDLSPEKAQQAAEQFMTGMAEAITGSKRVAEERKNAPQEENWLKMVGLE